MRLGNFVKNCLKIKWEKLLNCNINIKLFYFYNLIVEYMVNNNNFFFKVYFQNWTFSGHKTI